MKRDCLKFLAVSFSKIDEVSFNAIISFSPIIIIIVIITIGFLILVLFIWLYFQFFIYDSLLSILLCLYLFSFLLYLFLILSSFLFHFSRFISFFAVFFFCASNETIACFICMSLFSVLSSLTFWKSSEKNAKTVRTTRKTQVPLPLLLYCDYRSWAGQFYTLFLSTLPYLSWPPYPELGHPRRQSIVTQSNKPKHLAEHNSIPHGGRKNVSLTCVLHSTYTMHIYNTS